MTDDIDGLAKAMVDELMKFNPLKPWAEMTEEDKGKFVLLGKWFVYKLEHSPIKGWDEDARHRMGWPFLLVQLRCHGRSFRNLVVEYEADPEGFLAETDRQASLWGANLNAYAKEVGEDPTFDHTPVPEMRKLFDLLIKMIKRKIDAGEE